MFDKKVSKLILQGGSTYFDVLLDTLNEVLSVSERKLLTFYSVN